MLKVQFILILAIVATTFFNSNAQEDYKKSKNLNTYTPSVLLSKGQLEVKLFNNFYTQTAYFDNKSRKIDVGRQNYLGSFIQVLYGFSDNNRLNLGFDILLLTIIIFKSCFCF